MRQYSFCKAHSFHYAYLVWALFYQKAHNPIKFWVATLNNCHSMYHRWVHYREAINAGVVIPIGFAPWKLLEDGATVISVNTKKKKQISNPESFKTKVSQFRRVGYWTSNEFIENMYVKVVSGRNVRFRGLIAASKWNRKGINGKTKYSTFITIGYKNGHYIDLILNKWQTTMDYDIISGDAIVKTYKHTNYLSLDVLNYKMERL